MNEDEQNPRLEKALKAMARDRVFVPPSADEKIVGTIREHFQTAKEAGTPVTPDAGVSEAAKKDEGVLPRGSTARKLKHWQKWMPLAASIAIAGLILYFSRPIPDRADINRDGTVNVIDALILAEQLRAGKGRDVNGDGTVNEVDAAEIAARAVDLERSGT
jgi:hypothetical protein